MFVMLIWVIAVCYSIGRSYGTEVLQQIKNEVKNVHYKCILQLRMQRILLSISYVPPHACLLFLAPCLDALIWPNSQMCIWARSEGAVSSAAALRNHRLMPFFYPCKSHPHRLSDEQWDNGKLKSYSLWDDLAEDQTHNHPVSEQIIYHLWVVLVPAASISAIESNTAMQKTLIRGKTRNIESAAQYIAHNIKSMVAFR